MPRKYRSAFFQKGASTQVAEVIPSLDRSTYTPSNNMNVFTSSVTLCALYFSLLQFAIAQTAPQVYSSHSVEGDSKSDAHIRSMWSKPRFVYQISGDMEIVRDGNQTQESRQGWFAVERAGTQKNWIKCTYFKRPNTTLNVSEGDMIVLSRISYQQSLEVVPSSNQKTPGFEYQANIVAFDKNGQKIKNYPIMALLGDSFFRINNPDELFESTAFHKTGEWEVYSLEDGSTAIRKRSLDSATK